MIRRLWLLCSLCAALALPSLPASIARAKAPSAVRTSITSHGLRLTLTVPARTYPRNALIQVTLTMKNVSRHTVLISRNNPPRVLVTDPSGKVVYDPSSPLGDAGFPVTGGPHRPPRKLHAGASMTIELYLVLRDAFLQPDMSVLVHGAEWSVAGHRLQLQLVDAPAPTVTISSSPSLHATITPPGPVQGPLLYVSIMVCHTARGTTYSAPDGLGWGSVDGNELAPEFDGDCGQSREWHAVAGWEGEPIAVIDFVQQ